MKNIRSKQQAYANRIKKLRRDKNWSQRDLAKEFGVSPGAVAHWETGERELSGPIRKLLDIYEKSLLNREGL